MRYKVETNDEHEHLAAVHGSKYKAVLRDLDSDLRDAVKYGGNEAHIKHAQIWRDALRQILSEAGLTLED